MDFPSDILHYIFSFLKADPESLIACSNTHPSFSPIAEKYLYYHITIQTSLAYRAPGSGYCLEPSQLLELLSESLQIANHVRVLQLTFEHDSSHSTMVKYDEMAQILPLFRLVKCIMLRSHSISWWMLPQTLKTAVENCCLLPTTQEIHIGRSLTFPLSLLTKNPHVTCLSFLAYPEMADQPDRIYPPLQLKSLRLTWTHHTFYDYICTWTKPHITTLRSLQCQYSSQKMVLEFLDVCSGTLNNLDLELQAPYRNPLINLSSLRDLQHLTIRAHTRPEHPRERLSTAAKILKTASSSLQHLTIEILVESDSDWHMIDFSPLTMLAEASAPFHHIDLYTKAPFVNIYPKLARYEGLKKLIKEGILIIHAEQTAPGISRFE